MSMMSATVPKKPVILLKMEPTAFVAATEMAFVFFNGVMLIFVPKVVYLPKVKTSTFTALKFSP